MNQLLYYFRTQREDVLKGFRADKMKVAHIEGEAQRFADRFGASPLFSVGFASAFVGITFTKKDALYHPDLWTKPTPENPWMIPRSPERAGAKQKARAERLYKEFYDHFPKHLTEERPSALLDALKLTLSEMHDGQVLTYRETNNTAYIVSTLPLHLRSELEEITCSDFLAGTMSMPSELQLVTEEEALAGIAAQQQEAANNGASV